MLGSFNKPPRALIVIVIPRYALCYFDWNWFLGMLINQHAYTVGGPY
jgi:hypothetical protein